MMRLAACLVVAAFAVAGCNGPGGGPSMTTTSTGPVASPGFDGQAAWDFTDALVNDGAELRPRVPGQPGQQDTATWLAGQMDVPGWDLQRQDFTGMEYAMQDKGAVEGFHESPVYCTDPDRSGLGALDFSNLIAWRNVTDRPTLMLGAHWDAKEEANLDPDPDKRDQVVPAANDGASGVGVLLQFMRHVATDIGVDYGLAVAFFDGEDGFEDCHPLAGSIQFVAEMEEGAVDRLILLDMVGDPDGGFIRERQSVESALDLVHLLWSHAARLGDERFLDPAPPNAFHCGGPIYDDHTPFIHAGIPAVDIIDYGHGDRPCRFPPYWHTTADTMENLTPAAMASVGDVLWLTLEDSAFWS